MRWRQRETAVRHLVVRLGVPAVVFAHRPRLRVLAVLQQLVVLARQVLPRHLKDAGSASAAARAALRAALRTVQSIRQSKGKHLVEAGLRERDGALDLPALADARLGCGRVAVSEIVNSNK